MTSTPSNPNYPIILQFDISGVPLCEEKVYEIDENMKTNASQSVN